MLQNCKQNNNQSQQSSQVKLVFSFSVGGQVLSSLEHLRFQKQHISAYIQYQKYLIWLITWYCLCGYLEWPLIWHNSCPFQFAQLSWISHNRLALDGLVLGDGWETSKTDSQCKKGPFTYRRKKYICHTLLLKAVLYFMCTRETYNLFKHPTNPVHSTEGRSSIRHVQRTETEQHRHWLAQPLCSIFYLSPPLSQGPVKIDCQCFPHSLRIPSYPLHPPPDQGLL